MPVEELSPTSIMVSALVAAGSIVVLGWLAIRLSRGKAPLEYRSRVSVPWTITAAVLLQIPTLVVLLTTLLSAQTSAAPSKSFMVMLWADTLTKLGATVATYLLLHYLAGADGFDLGLPASSRELMSDLGLGAVAFFACILPVNMLGLLLQKLSPPETMHPFIEQMLDSKAPGMFAAVAIAAVIQAPLFEETAFRLVFQGWLEKWEDRLTGFTATSREPVLVSPEDWADEVAAAILIEEASERLPLEERNELGAAGSEVISPPQRRLISWLPHGWLPIIVSALVFGLAHLGHGGDPVPLVLLGVVLGYLYQRTHRIVPCITLHALFNAFSIIQLWLIISEQ